MPHPRRRVPPCSWFPCADASRQNDLPLCESRSPGGGRSPWPPNLLPPAAEPPLGGLSARPPPRLSPRANATIKPDSQSYSESHSRNSTKAKTLASGTYRCRGGPGRAAAGDLDRDACVGTGRNEPLERGQRCRARQAAGTHDNRDDMHLGHILRAPALHTGAAAAAIAEHAECRTAQRPQRDAQQADRERQSKPCQHSDSAVVRLGYTASRLSDDPGGLGQCLRPEP